MKKRTFLTAVALLVLVCGIVMGMRPLPTAAQQPPKPGPIISIFEGPGIIVERKDGTQILLTEARTAQQAGKWWVVGRSVASSAPKPDTFHDTRSWIPIDEVRSLGEIPTKTRFEEITKALNKDK
jgi:hypothetical protein